MMAPRTGRPKLDNPRTNVVPIRLAGDELATIKAAADDEGRATGEYIRDAALTKAKRHRKKV